MGSRIKYFFDVGQQFGAWTVVGEGMNYITPDLKRSEARMRCRCKCGRFSNVNPAALATGKSTRCSNCARNLTAMYRRWPERKEDLRAIYKGKAVPPPPPTEKLLKVPPHLVPIKEVGSIEMRNKRRAKLLKAWKEQQENTK